MYSERDLIRKIRERFAGAGVEVGLGDDAAVVALPDGFSAVVCSDLLAENTHFRRRVHPADSVGFKAIAANASDVGAMGGIPAYCLVSLAVPSDVEDAWIDGFLEGVTKACRKFDVALVGGDSSAANSIVVDVAMLGRVETGRAVRRGGARPGDGIFVTGSLGGSALGLSLIETEQPGHPAIQRHLYPEPRHRIGRLLASRATAMIDVSDGLSVDLAHIIAESSVSARIERDAIPCHPGASVEQALHGGEDYELIITSVDMPSEIDGVALTRIGDIVEGENSQIFLRGSRGEVVIEPGGWEHFRR